ncbi:hypothetical protein [Roseobacter sp.]|uniref:capsular polysaccharide export protein, LipB/KpsS family n=1 Tax=Roseobacter sp. TaxID=1907202 RepID=UPI0032977215
MLIKDIFLSVLGRSTQRRAIAFQERQRNRLSPSPMGVEFPTSLDTTRLIVLTDAKDLKGRAAFLEGLGGEILFDLPNVEQETDYVVCFGYSDFLRNVGTLEKSGWKKVLLLEAGFLRSVLMDGSASRYDQAICFFVDNYGFHYDPTFPSQLEDMANHPDLEILPHELERAAKLRDKIIYEKLTKYNDQSMDNVLPDDGRARVLVVEQARNDWAIRKSRGGRKSFERMVDCALSENPDAEIVLKVHPDSLNGKRGGLEKSYFGRHRDEGRIRVVREKINPLVLMERTSKVYVFSSMLGFEAALMNNEVHLFGQPSYGGWGFTVDRSKFARRTRNLSLLEYFYLVYFRYQKYIGTDGKPCEPEDAVEALIALRDEYHAETQSHISTGAGMSVAQR